MFKFFLKKNFADGWENLFFMILCNVIVTAVGAGCAFGIFQAGKISQLGAAGAFVVFAGFFSSAVFSWGACAAKIADFRAASFKVFFLAFRRVFGIAFVFGALFAVFILIVRFGIAYYLSDFLQNGSKISLLFTAVLVWFTLVCVIALQWFVPLYYLQESNGFSKCLKKSFIIFFDNAGFSVGIFFYNIFLFALSVLTIGIAPGVNGLTLSCMNALRLRLYKYDWIEEMSAQDPDFINSRDKRSEVPWDELLADDKESLGAFKLSRILFPWK